MKKRFFLIVCAVASAFALAHSLCFKDRLRDDPGVNDNPSSLSNASGISSGHYFFPDESVIPENPEDCCLNRDPLRLDCGSECSLSLGRASDSRVGIYLDPHFEYPYARNPFEQYGFLFRCLGGELEVKQAEAVDGETDYIITGRTYDKRSPASFRSEDCFGVRWIPDRDGSGVVRESAEISVHVIRLSDGMLMAAAKAEIDYLDEVSGFALTGLRGSDVSTTGELTESERNALIQDAASFLSAGNDKLALPYSVKDIRNHSAEICVEKLERPLYSKLFSASGKPLYSSRLSGMILYAVHLPCTGLGFVTVYFAPETQINGLREEHWGTETDRLAVTGYDAVCPLAEDRFRSFLQPQDIEFFF